MLTRLVTRTAEFPNTGEFVLYEGDMPFALYVSWQFATKKSEEDVVLVRAPYPYIIQGGGSHVLSREHLRLSYTHTYYHRGINYGRFNVSGIYYPSGKQEFRILKVQMGNSEAHKGIKEEGDCSSVPYYWLQVSLRAPPASRSR